MKCSEKKCDLEAEYIVYWPGHNPPPKYCLNDMIKAKEILNLMGVPVVIEEIK